jgi:Fur family ferric uptake transcriptional regulator
MSDACDFPQLLARHGLRLTPVRLEVLAILGAEARPWRAAEILEAVRRRRRVNKVTIYRILEDFLRRGLVRKVPLEGKAARFELACEHHPPHPHFQCQACGEVQCLQPVPLEALWDRIQGPLGNRAERLEIRVEGVCRQCREAEEGP